MRSRLRSLVLLQVLTAGFVSAQTPQDEFFTANGIRIRYVVQGAGEPVVLVHGYTLSVETQWMESGVFANLAKDYRVIALDLRGHGKSDKPHDASAYRELADDVIRLLDHVGVQRAHFVGYSAGASLVGKLLTTSPGRFLTATLAGGSPILNWTAESDRYVEVAARELAAEVPFRSPIIALTPPDEPQPTEAEIRRLSQAAAARNDLKALAAYQRGGRRPLLTSPDEVAAVRVPVLGIVGSLDAAVTSLTQLHAILPAMTLVVISGATHVGARSAVSRAEFADALRHFIAANRSRSAQ